MAWWRAYDEALDDPKLQRGGLERVGLWFNLMCLASRNGGVLPSTDDVVFALRTTPEDFGPKFKALADAGLFDKTKRGWEPHNWNGRQYRSDVSTERVRRFRKRDETVSETPSESESEQSRAEQIVERAGARKTQIPPDWQPTTELIEYAKAQGCQDPADTFERFRLHFVSTGKVHKNWTTAAQYWCRNEKNFRRPEPQKQNGHASPPTAEEPWEKRMAWWRKSQFWQPMWGPKPNESGCVVPKQYLGDA